jgi:hypothetical protein
LHSFAIVFGAFFPIISADLKSALNFAYFEFFVAKKIIKFFGGFIESQIEYVLKSLRMQIRKKWINQLKNVFNKHFKNVIWQLFDPIKLLKSLYTTTQLFLGNASSVMTCDDDAGLIMLPL